MPLGIADIITPEEIRGYSCPSLISTVGTLHFTIRVFRELPEWAKRLGSWFKMTHFYLRIFHPEF